MVRWRRRGTMMLSRRCFVRCEGAVHASHKQQQSHRPNLFLAFHCAHDHMFSSLALHKLIQKDAWERVIGRIDSHPQECRKLSEIPSLTDAYGTKCSGLPLHAALSRRAPLRVIRKLLRVYPDSIRMRETGYQRPPLHVCLMHHNHPKITLYLIRRDNAMVTVRDTLQRTAMHYSVANDCGVEVFEVLRAVAPDLLSSLDHRRWMPLHLACGSSFLNRNVSIVKMLVDQYPSALSHRGDDGKLPLELLKEHPHVTKELVDFLSSSEQRTSISVPRLVVIVGSGKDVGGDDNNDDGTVATPGTSVM